MKPYPVPGRMQKLASLISVVFFICLSFHFHDGDAFSHSHFHNLTLSGINHASSNLLTDGHICPCFMATLTMPGTNGLLAATLIETNLTFFGYPYRPLSLTWEIFHPPQAI